MTDAARWKATVYVGGLAGPVTQRHIQDAFAPFGEVADVSLPKNENPNAPEPHRGFAYVEFEDADDAKEAIDNMDQSEFFGKVLKVTAAKAPKTANEGLGSRTALWEQVSCHDYSITVSYLPMPNKTTGRLACGACCQRRRQDGRRSKQTPGWWRSRRSHARAGES